MSKYLLLFLLPTCKSEIGKELRMREYSIQDEITWYTVIGDDTTETTTVESGTMILSDNVTTIYDTDTDEGEWSEVFTLQKNNQTDIEIVGFAWVDLQIDWSGVAYGTDTLYLPNSTLIYERTIKFEKFK